MAETLVIPGLAFGAGTCLVVLLAQLLGRRGNWLESRLNSDPVAPEEEADHNSLAKLTRKALPKIGKALEPTNAAQLSKLKLRLVHAGLYSRGAMSLFLGVKMLLMVAPIAFAGLAVAAGGIPLFKGFLYGLTGSCLGMVLPSLWLDRRKTSRQTALRRALPDALDMIGLCLEGGMSMPSAFKLIVGELKLVHPVLVAELGIAEREMTLGRTTGEALKEFADRSDLEEVRILASVVLQSERLGSSLLRAMRINSDSLRHKRIQRAEELAHKAGVKVLFPTLLCIFPAIFLIVLGPAVIHISAMFARMQH